MSPLPPLVILGFDAGDPGYLLQWAREGQLPTLASVLRRGCWARTGGPELVSEHGVWLQLFSGLSRGQTGYYYFRQLESGTYRVRPVNGLELDASPFWASLDGGEKKVAIFDVPEVSPVIGLRGIQLANWSVHRGWVSRDPAHQPQAEPRLLLDEARRIFGPPSDIVENSNSDFDDDRRVYGELLDQVQKSGKLYRELLGRDRFDLIVAVFSASHTASHQFWKYRPEARGENELTYAIRDIYQAIDREMGLLLAQLPAATNVVIASSVGFGDYYPTAGLIESFCRQLDYQASPPSALSLPAVLRKIVPESWRVGVSRHLPREARERLLADQFRRKTDWRKTTAFAIPSFYTSFIRINLRGREPEGVVAPGAECEALLQRLEADLKRLVDPDTHEPVVGEVVRTREAFGAGAHEALPDLFVVWRPAARFRSRVLHPNAEIVQKRPEWFRGSDHSKVGFMSAAGPLIQARGDLGEIPLTDLAPTFLALLDDVAPPVMRGKARHAMIGPPAPGI